LSGIAIDRILSSWYSRQAPVHYTKRKQQLMNAIPTAYLEFGQTLAFTDRTLTAVLRDHLAQQGVGPETWYALKLVSQGGSDVARTSIVRDLEGSPRLDGDSTQALLAQLTSDGLIAGDDAVHLTEEGRVFFESLRDHVLGATVNLLGQFDLSDVETTVRTCKAIMRRAQEQAESAA
jgi:hypothetical protein